MKPSAAIKAFLAITFWGASFVAKVALREVSPLTVIVMRFAIGLSGLAMVVAARQEFTLGIDAGNCRRVSRHQPRPVERRTSQHPGHAGRFLDAAQLAQLGAVHRAVQAHDGQSHADADGDVRDGLWLAILPLWAGAGGWLDLPRLTAAGWGSLLFLGLLCSGAAYVFWYDALAAAGASQVAAFLYLEPIVTVIVAASLIGEAVTWATLVGGETILIGVWLVNQREAKSKEHGA